jgi:acetyl esterase/lipase
MKTIAIAFSFFTVTLMAQTPRSWKDINYAGDTLTGHRLDIYLPAKGDGPFPVVVAIAGSAWFGDNTKDRAFTIAKSLLDRGFAVVAMNHRSSREAIWPAQINDAKAVVRFIRAHHKQYQLDTGFIGITGDSSGGHLSAMMGTSGGIVEQALDGRTVDIEGHVGDYNTESSRVDAVTVWYGPSNFLVMDSCGSSFSHNDVKSPESTLVGGPIQEEVAMCRLADPTTYADASDPEFLILHGDADQLVPHCQGEYLFDRLKSKGVRCALIIVPGGGHGKGMWEPPYIEKMNAFFTDQLNRKPKK